MLSQATLIENEDEIEFMLPENSDDRWASVRNRFLARVSPGQRRAVANMLQQPLQGGRGLRVWMHRLLAEDTPLPESLPEELVQTYIDEPEAMPLHDCGSCGVAIPIEPGWLGIEGEPQRLFFPECPCCGSTTGLYAFWSRAAELDGQGAQAESAWPRQPR